MVSVRVQWLRLQDSPIKAFGFLQIACIMCGNTLLQCLFNSQFHEILLNATSYMLQVSVLIRYCMLVASDLSV